jgi:ankyrin repeat protein
LTRIIVVKRQIVVAAVLAVLLTASAYAQSTDFFQLVCYGTPQQVQPPINTGADIKARAKEGRTALTYAAINPNPEIVITS